MTWLIFALGAGMAIAGGASVYLGYPYISVEWGWTEVLAGTMLLSAGAVVVALGAVLLRLGALRRAVQRSGFAGEAASARSPVPPEPQPAVMQRGSAPTAMPEDWGGGAPVLTRDALAVVREAPVAVREAPVAAHAMAGRPAPLTERAYDPEPAPAFDPAERSAEALLQPTAPETAAALPPRGSLLATLRSRMNRGKPEAMPSLQRPLDAAPPAADVPRNAAAAAGAPLPRHDPEATFEPLRTAPSEASGFGHGEALAPPTAADPDDAAARPFAASEMAAAPGLQPDYGAEDHAPSAGRAAGAEAYAAGEEPTVVGRYQAGGASYVLYSDGTIEVETEAGIHRFASMQELKAYIERSA